MVQRSRQGTLASVWLPRDIALLSSRACEFIIVASGAFAADFLDNQLVVLDDRRTMGTELL